MNAKQMDLFNERLEWAEKLGRQLHDRMGGASGCEAEDFQQLAALGLIDAINRFKPHRAPNGFEPYAAKRIKGFVRDELRKIDEVGKSRRAAGVCGPISLDHATLGDDGDRVLVLRDRLESPRRKDRLEAWEQLEVLLYGLCTEARAVAYLAVAGELENWQIAAVMGLTTEQIRELRHEADDFLASQRTTMPGASAKKPARDARREAGLFEDVSAHA
jgi:RNA polymerase sigma factor (sigma-70 family)